MYIKISFVIFISWLLVAVSYAQEKPMGSRLVDESGVGVGYAAIIALSVADSSIVASTMSDEQGWFNLSVDSLYDSELLYEFSCPRYVKTSFVGGVLPPQIVMESALIVGDNITEVVVNARKTSFTCQGDRYVFRLSDDLELVKNSTVYDILKLTPLVSVNDVGGGIYLSGSRGASIYINGRRSRMSETALTEYLKSIPATLLSNIEVIPVANSTYSGQGIFGVIDIKLRKQPGNGVIGLVVIGASQAHSTSEFANTNFDIRKNKVGLNVSLWGANSGNAKNISNTDVLFLENSNRTNTLSNAYESNATYGANLKMDYDISERQVVGFVVNADFSERKGYSTAKTIYGNQAGGGFVIDSMYNTGINSSGYRHTISANVNYQIKTDTKGSRFTIDADYVSYQDTRYQTTVFDKLKEDQTIDYNFNTMFQRMPQKLLAWTAKAQYDHSFSRWGLLSVGADFQSTTNDDNSYYANGDWGNKNTNLSNHFVYTEILPALFASYSVNWTNKFSTTLGGRMEYTYTNAQQRTTGAADKTYRMKFLPSVFLSYMFDQDNQLSYSVTNRMIYPPYSFMNSFRIYTSPDSYEQGNPYLKPERNLFQQINYMYKAKLNVFASHLIINDGPKRQYVPNYPTGMREIFVNIGSETQTELGVGMYGSYFNDYWQANNSAKVIYLDEQGITENEPFHSYSTVFVMELNNTVILSKKHNVLVNLAYYLQSSTSSNRFYGAPINYFSASLRKMIGKQWFVSVEWFDIFNQWRRHDINYNNGIENRMDTAYDSSKITLRVGCRFGGNVKSSRQRSTSADNLKGRL